eukprot:5938128-Amphidinium_carterae.1
MQQPTAVITDTLQPMRTYPEAALGEWRELPQSPAPDDWYISAGSTVTMIGEQKSWHDMASILSQG